MEASEGIGSDSGIRAAHMRSGIDIVKRRGDSKPLSSCYSSSSTLLGTSFSSHNDRARSKSARIQNGARGGACKDHSQRECDGASMLQDAQIQRGAQTQRCCWCWRAMESLQQRRHCCNSEMTHWKSGCLNWGLRTFH